METLATIGIVIAAMFFLASLAGFVIFNKDNRHEKAEKN